QKGPQFWPNWSDRKTNGSKAGRAYKDQKVDFVKNAKPEKQARQEKIKQVSTLPPKQHQPKCKTSTKKSANGCTPIKQTKKKVIRISDQQDSGDQSHTQTQRSSSREHKNEQRE